MNAGYWGTIGEPPSTLWTASTRGRAEVERILDDGSFEQTEVATALKIPLRTANYFEGGP